MSACVVCVGNELRGDDAVALEVLRRLDGSLPAGVRAVACAGEPVALITLLEGCDTAVVVDATRSGAPPGTVRRIPAHEGPLPAELRRASTHLLGVADAVELARALGSLPARTIVYGIEGAVWETGAPLTPEVSAAAAAVAVAVAHDLAEDA